MDIADFILKKLDNDLPRNLYYHCAQHTRDVYQAAVKIGEVMGINEDEMLLLETAALFHDAGFLVQYANHEEAGCKLVNELLPQFNYSASQINTICDMIRATKVPQSPKNLLEEILCDADLDYLGREDFEPIAKTLFMELKEHGIIQSEEQWNKIQIGFLRQHSYFTPYSQKLRSAKKTQHIYTIEKIVLNYPL